MYIEPTVILFLFETILEYLYNLYFRVYCKGYNILRVFEISNTYIERLYAFFYELIKYFRPLIRIFNDIFS